MPAALNGISECLICGRCALDDFIDYHIHHRYKDKEQQYGGNGAGHGTGVVETMEEHSQDVSQQQIPFPTCIVAL